MAREHPSRVEMRVGVKAADPRRTSEQRRAAASKDLRERWTKEDATWAAPLAPSLTRVASGDLRKTSTTKRLRHGATTPEQEYDRDVEMRDALKVAKKQADKTWRTLVDTIPKELNLEERAAWMAARISEHGDLRALEKVARATARKTLRERWAKEDAASADPLGPGLTRMTPDDLHDGNSLVKAREAYLDELRKLGDGARGNEPSGLTEAWQQIDEERRRAPTAGDQERRAAQLAASEARRKSEHG